MRFIDFLTQYDESVCEVVYVDASDNILSEAAIRAYKRQGHDIIRKYRCMSGRRTGKLVTNPADCMKKLDRAKVIAGRRIMRSKGKQIHHKAEISKKQSLSKRIARMNRIIRHEPS